MNANHPPHQDSIFFARIRLEPAVLVHIYATEGSVPREAGTWMAVFPEGLVGTIGGGQLEHQAIIRARLALKAKFSDIGKAQMQRVALGPALGQCCGGVVHLRFEKVTLMDLPNLLIRLRPHLLPVALFGGGHVGHALTRLLSSLPFAVTWVDSRDGVFPGNLPDNVVCEQSEPVQAAVRDLTPDSRVLIMSFSHAEDFDVVTACLQRQRVQADLPYIGLIGSATKWASFRQRLEARGFTAAELAQVTSPIGVPGIQGKAPEVIAVAVAAQLLQTL